MMQAQATNLEDRFNLARFISAQGDDYQVALSELQQGSKESCWMWYIFPQVQGLGFSSTTQHFSIKSVDEAREYLNHEVLGKRLLECSEALLAHKDKSASEIMGYPDDLKLKSSMTLFSKISAPNSVFHQVLSHYFDNQVDQRTIDIMDQMLA